MLQRIVFLEKGEWKRPFQSAYMCSYHFSPPVIVKDMSLCPSNISPFPVCSGSYLSHLFTVHIFTPFFPIFSFSPFLQVPFQYLNMLKSLLFLNSSSPWLLRNQILPLFTLTILFRPLPFLSPSHVKHLKRIISN